jgi:hypothetical protein
MKRLVFAVSFLLGLSISTAFSASDSAAGLQFHPFTMVRSGCTSEVVHGQYRNCDPVNLLFPGKTWREVRDALVAEGWTSLGFGSTQYMHVGSSSRIVSQNAQLFKGPCNDRLHIRLWQSSAGTVGAVHHDTGSCFVHTLGSSWEAAEAAVANALCDTAACSTAFLASQDAAQDGGSTTDVPTWRGLANDNNATVIALP